ncbi:Hachiman antiphage defense system protein HamA [Bradyrhizobium oligotrophicum]|uniref:Hachiman antiphage defense system protein HamA n=1 Tax=Bradyrhizobium oligotrophicum TaxID=44255 RepID=UPI003EBA21E3
MFDDWCDEVPAPAGAHTLRILTARPEDLAFGAAAVAAEIPGHYASEEHIARVLERLGKPAAAALIREKLPTTKSIRSGDLGEILATEYIAEKTDYDAPIKRLRWKDHRNMALRGDDVIGMRVDDNGALHFLKTEAKSRVNLPDDVLTEARAALEKHQGLPSPHALEFISERLFEQGNTELADAIDDALLKTGITPDKVCHLLFTFSGNDPTTRLQTALNDYGGTIAQMGVGLRVATHANFVGDVYEKVITDGDGD